MIGHPERLIPGAAPSDTNPCDDTHYYTPEKKPWWLRLFTKRCQWVAIAPYVYYPASLVIEPKPLDFVGTPARGVLCYGIQINPIYKPLLRHEVCHLTQQRRMGKWRFLFSYIFSRRFRLAAEAEAIAVELMWRQPDERRHYATAYAAELVGRPYFWAARSQYDAMHEIVVRLEELGGVIGLQ